jgi:hypothetical protein
MIKEKQQEFAEKKGKKSDGGCSCKVVFFLFGVVKIPSFMMIQPSSPAFNVFFSIQSLNLALFDSILGPKKSFESVPRTWAKTLLAARNPYFQH